MPISSGAGTGAGTAEFCAHCGQAIPEGRKFCGHCGSPVPGAGSGDQVPVTAAAPPPPPAPQPAKVRRRLSRRTVILLSVLGTLVAALAVGAFFFLNALRGGADSPEQAVEKALEALSNEDLVGAFSMVSPHERDAVVRVQDALVKKAEEIDMAGAASKVAPKDSGEGGSELVFDGIDVSFSGIEPFVTEVSDDVAVVRISSGQIRVNTDPAQTKGALRSVLDNVPDAKATEQTIEIRDLGPSQSGLSLMATKTDGRWFVNLSMSALEAVNNYQGSARGFLAKPGETGGDNPAEAAKGLVQALPSQMPASVAPFLAKEEANAMYLYGHLWNEFAGSSTGFSIGNADFTEGPRNGGRAQAYVSQISVETRSDDRFTVSDKCMSNGSSNRDATCLTGSAYKPSPYGVGGVDWMSALLSQDGKFALSTVEEGGKWKVSVLDTVADHAVGAINGLTKEQALAMTGLARSQDSSGSLTLGESATVEFNNAGFAVKALKLEKPMRLALDKNSEAGTVILHSEDDKTKQFYVYSGGSGDIPTPAGDYKVVVWAGSDFSEAFARDGNAARDSASVGISEYVEPPSVDGQAYSSRNYVSSSSDETFTVRAPSAPASLRIAITSSSSSSSSSKGVVATIDGKSYTIGGAEASSKSIPVPQGTHQLKLRGATDTSSSGRSSFSYSYTYVDLSFDSQ